VGFVVLTFLWGLGAAIYLALWALVPRDGADEVPTSGSSKVGLRTFVLLAAAVVIGLLFSTPFWGGPRWGGGIALAWVVFMVVLVVLSLRRPEARLSLGRVLAVALLGGLSLVIIAVGAFSGVVAMTGVPLSGGIGDRLVQPTSLAQVQRTYRMAMGTMTVDLRQLPFAQTTLHVTATVAVGRLLVEVPPGTVVSVTARSGIGRVDYGPGGAATFNLSAAATRPQLVLVAQVGIGQVELVRGSPQSAL
jgi:hypothetical protein